MGVYFLISFCLCDVHQKFSFKSARLPPPGLNCFKVMHTRMPLTSASLWSFQSHYFTKKEKVSSKSATACGKNHRVSQDRCWWTFIKSFVFNLGNECFRTNPVSVLIFQIALFNWFETLPSVKHSLSAWPTCPSIFTTFTWHQNSYFSQWKLPPHFLLRKHLPSKHIFLSREICISLLFPNLSTCLKQPLPSLQRERSESALCQSAHP